MQMSTKLLIILICTYPMLLGCQQAVISVDSLSPKTSNSSHFPNTVVGPLGPLYSSSALWLDYIKSDGGNEYSATGGAVCDGTETRAKDCIHAGEMKVITVSGVSSCSGMTAVDDLGVFDWNCFISSGSVKLYSILKTDKGLKDLLNTNSWKPNSLSLYKDNSLISKTTSSIWWLNTITPYTPIATPQDFNTPNMIYTVNAAASFGGFRMNSDKVAIVGIGASIISLTYLANNVCGATGVAGTSDCGVAVPETGVKYNWIENLGFNMSASPNYGLLIPGAQFFNLRNLEITGVTSGTGINLGSSGTPISKLNKFYNIDILSNSSTGLYINHINSSYNYFEHLSVQNNGGRGIDVSNAIGNEFKIITTFNNNLEGIRISSAHQTKISIFSAEQNTGSGLSIANSNDVKFSQGDIINNGPT
jgi:hypothetical protein